MFLLYILVLNAGYFAVADLIVVLFRRGVLHDLAKRVMAGMSDVRRVRRPC